MTRLTVAAVCAALSLVTFFQFPGHTWLQQDSQIYVPILEQQRDPGVLRNDPLVSQPHVAYTLYDEIAQVVRAAGLPGFQAVLQVQQVATRAFGVWGLYLMATAAGLGGIPALAIAAIVSLGATVVGPAVLTVEYEPTPRAFAVPLLVCAMGLATHGRNRAAGIAGAAAFLYHPPTALPFWLVAPLAVRNGRGRLLAPLGIAAVVLLTAARVQGGAQPLWARLTPAEEQLQRLRASYVWISTWPPSVILHYCMLAALAGAAYWRTRQHLAYELRGLMLGLPALGLLSMPVSALLLERFKWALVPQLQPLRTLLFVTVCAVFLCAVAGMHARRWESIGWLTCAYLLPIQPLLTGPFRLASGLAVLLAALTTAAPPLALAAFLAIPWLGGVVNYPRLHTPELAALSGWARTSTPKDAVFVFPDAGRALYPGIFRAESLRAVYVDWKSGGQVNYIPGFGEDWWFRWQQTMAAPINPRKYDGLGISYFVVRPEHRMAESPVFECTEYLVYKTGSK